MTPAQTLQLRAAEIQARLAELAEVSELSAEQSAEVLALNTERKALPGKLEAAMKAEEADASLRNEGDGAFAEMASVTAQASVGEFFGNLFNKRQHEGALAELQQHYGMGRNELPLDLLRGADGVQAAVTPAPDNTRRTEQPVLQPVFHSGDAAFLAVSMPTVESGDATFPVLTERPAVGGPFKDSTPVGETTGAFSAEVLQPDRLQASFFYRRTDATRFPQMDSALRSALAMGLSEAMDKEIIDQLVADVSRSAASSGDTYDSYRKRLVYDHIDGRFASMESNLRVLLGSQTLADMSPLFRGEQGDVSAVENIRRLVSGVRVSPHIAPAASDKQDAIVRRGMRRDMVAPVWRNVEIIFDEVTKAATGEIVLTAFLQSARKVIRADGFARVETQHA